jgi:hypothetical protein
MKTSIATFFLPIGVVLIATAGPTSANLIVNGDFETHDFTGWTVTQAATGSNLDVEQLPPAHDTLGAAFRANGSDFDSISQTFATTPGASYDFSFFYQPIGFGPPFHNGFRALFNGVVLYENLDTQSGFIFQTFTVQATGSQTTVEFQGRNVGGVDYLDDVFVGPTPTQSGAQGSGYWANHPLAWCSDITLCQSYSEAQIIAIMKNPTKGDMTYQLAAQLAAAKLNVQCNLTDSSCVAGAIAAAEDWLCDNPIGSNVTAKSQVWKDITPTYNTLANYNNGLLCAPPGG